MSLVLKLAGVTIPTEAVKAKGRNEAIPGGIDGFPMAAWYGETPAAGFFIDDPDGIYDDILLQPWVTFTADEDECSRPRIFTGWLTARSILRGGYRTGAGRVWDCTIFDINALWGFMAFRASSAKRPVEPDIVRAEFCRASGPMGITPVADNGRWNITDNPINLNEADYVGQYPLNMMESFAGTAGKNFFAYWDHDEEEISGYYDLVTAMPVADMKISNVLADYDPSPGIGDPAVFLPLLDGQLDLDPQNYYTGELLNYKGSYAYGIRQATIDAIGVSDLSPSGLQRDVVRSTDRIGLPATAAAQIVSDLDRMANEEGTITITVQLPNTHVNLCEAGYALPLKLTHIPGFEDDFVNIPIVRRNVVPTQDRRDMYDVHLELNAGTKLASQPGGGPPGVFVPPRACDPDSLVPVNAGVVDLDVSSNGTIPFGPTIGNTLVVQVGEIVKTASLSPDGFTAITGNIDTPADGNQDRRTRFWRRLFQSGDTTAIHLTNSGGATSAVRLLVWELPGEVTESTFVTESVGDQGCSSPWTQSLGTVTIADDTPTLLLGGILTRNDLLSTTFTAGSPSTEEPDGGGVGGAAALGGAYRIVSAAGSYDIDMTSASGGCQRGYLSAVIAFPCNTATDLCPDSGQWTDWELLAEGDGSTSQFTLRCPYADGGLLVKVDGLDVAIGLTETDPAAGVFDLDFAPKAAQGDAPAEQVWVKYQGR